MCRERYEEYVFWSVLGCKWLKWSARDDGYIWHKCTWYLFYTYFTVLANATAGKSTEMKNQKLLTKWQFQKWQSIYKFIPKYFFEKVGKADWKTDRIIYCNLPRIYRQLGLEPATRFPTMAREGGSNSRLSQRPDSVAVRLLIESFALVLLSSSWENDAI